METDIEVEVLQPLEYIFAFRGFVDPRAGANGVKSEPTFQVPQSTLSLIQFQNSIHVVSHEEAGVRVDTPWR